MLHCSLTGLTEAALDQAFLLTQRLTLIRAKFSSPSLALLPLKHLEAEGRFSCSLVKAHDRQMTAGAASARCIMPLASFPQFAGSILEHGKHVSLLLLRGGQNQILRLVSF